MGKFVLKYTIEEIKDFVENNSGCKLLSTEYLGIEEKLDMKCACNNDFKVSFKKFRDRNKRQCNECGFKKKGDFFRHDFEHILDVIKEDGSCSYVSGEYITAQSLLTFKCACGEDFKTSFQSFLSNNKRQCNECGNKKNSESKCKYTYEYIFDLMKENGATLKTEKFDKYLRVKDKILFECKCGEVEDTTVGQVITCNKFICNICSFKNAPSSKGELEIKKYLDENNYIYRTEYGFIDCVSTYKLRFDFAIFDDNNLLCIIEFDGKQHYQAYEYYGGEEKFNLVKLRDEIKNKYCLEKNIKLIRIPYWDIDKIKEILDESLAMTI